MFDDIGISVDLLQRHGVRRVTDPEARDLLSSHHPGDLAGILFPRVDPETGHRVGARVRRDHPEIENGKPKAKYLSSYGDRPHIFFTSNAAELLQETGVTVVAVEAEKSALALMAAATRLDRQILPIPLGGCHGWHTSNAGKTTGPNGERVNEAGVNPDLLRVTWTDRDVVILFDANTATNAKVRSARRQFAAELQSRGAKVRLGTVPAEPNVNGPDDYRAAHDDQALLAIVDNAVPIQPPTVDDVLEDCGFTALTDPVSMTALELALRELRDLMKSADAIRRKLTRAAVIDRLKALKVTGASAIVDASIGVTPEDDAPSPALVREDLPWPEPVNGQKVLDQVLTVLKHYLVLPVLAYEAVALWIVHAYAMNVWSISPILSLVSPVKRCGKTTTLLVVGPLVPRGLSVANVTAPVLFRVIEEYAPTLLADEADTWLTDEKSELRGIYNAGHTKGTAQVARCVGDDHTVQLFSVWAAKALAMIGRPPGTIEDRSVVVELRRKSPGEKVARLRLDRIEGETAPLRRMLMRWVADHEGELRAADPDVPNGLHDRDQDNWRPLLAVADVAGGHWPKQARAAALALCSKDASEDIGTELLADIRSVFEEAGNPEVMASAALLKALVGMEDRPWSTWSKGDKPMTGSKLARMLKPFKVVSAGTIRLGSETAKGYRREAFVDAWTRYLPGNTGFNASQCNSPNESGPEPAFSKRHTDASCDTLKNEETSMNPGTCYGVTDRNPVSGAEEKKEGDDGCF